MKTPMRSKIHRLAGFCATLSLLMALFNIAPLTSSAKIRPFFQMTTVPSELMFGLTTTNQLVSFRSNTPGTILSTVNITGLQPSEDLLGIDFRPATSELYGLGSTGRAYVINAVTGVASTITTTPTPLTGVSFGFDFNPMPDRIRVVSDSNLNLRLNPLNGNRADVPTNDGPLAYAAGDVNAGADPNVVAVGYTNAAFDPIFAASTMLFDIDSNLNILAFQNPPNAGTLNTIGSLGVDTTDIAGFDISGASGVAYASLNLMGTTSSTLYTVNLTTGAATMVGTIGTGTLLLESVTVSDIRSEVMFGLTNSNRLITFNSNDPGRVLKNVLITGLQTGEMLRGIDFRPVNGQLYGLGSTGRTYIINTATGVATSVTSTPATLSGTNFGVDFNPVPDRIRVVSDARQNIRLNPLNGNRADAPTPDGMLTYATGDVNAAATPMVVAAGYTNATFGPAPGTTMLFDIDAGLDVLAFQNPPNSGTLNTIGSLGVDTTSAAGFDISGRSGIAYASLNVSPATTSSLYSVSLTTGAATLIGTIGGGEIVNSVAVGEERIFALDANNNLMSFVSSNPSQLLSGPTPITGLQIGEFVQGMDFRPATAQLYALGSTGRTYIINPMNGVATQVGTAVVTLSGTNFGFDFNPVPDRIRVVSDARQDLRLNPNNGTLVSTDGIITYATGDLNAARIPVVTAVGYTNSFSGTTTTTLYDIDAATNTPGVSSILSIQNPPNNGTLMTQGNLNVTVGGSLAGFDIAANSNSAFAALSINNGLYSVNLSSGLVESGRVTFIGNIGTNVPVRDIAIVPATSVVTGLGLENPFLIAADTLNNRIQVAVDDSGNQALTTWRSIGGPGTALGTFNGPRGVAADFTGLNIFVADTLNNRVQRSTDGGLSWTLVAGPGTAVGTVNRPEGVAYNSSTNTLYIADTGNNRIQVVTNATTAATGSALVFAGATAGTALGKFNQPTSVAVDIIGRVYVADTANNRLQFNVDGSLTGWQVFAGATAGTALGTVNQPRGIFVDSQNRVYVADTANNRVMMNVGGLPTGWTLVAGPGTALGTVNAPRGVVLSSLGNLFIGDTANNRIQRRTSAGVFSAVGVPGPAPTPGQFNQPSGVN
ncbi:MAG: DUF4394 domain-containing protein [Acidobacteria bacterium]|nr:DUF4394 domain-containing protein [Acidobacteriota bacterium]